MAKYLDLTGLSHYDQKIKQYIAQHSGGSQLYLHVVTVVDNNEISYWKFITNSNTQITSFSLFVTALLNNFFSYYGRAYDSAMDDSNIIIGIRTITNVYIDLQCVNVDDEIKSREWTSSTGLTITDNITSL